MSRQGRQGSESRAGLWAAAFSLGVALLVSAGGQRLASAEGAKRSARLSYSRSADAQACPEEPAMRVAVAARLGYDPFVAESETLVVASIRRNPRGFEATIELRGAGGQRKGIRNLDSYGSDCSELASSVAFAISMAVDPAVAARTPTSAVSSAPSASPPPAASQPPAPPVASSPPPAPTIIYIHDPRPPPAPPPAAPAEPARLRVGLGLLGSIGSAPSTAFGFTAGVGIRWQSLSVGLEGRADLPASRDVEPTGSVSSSLLLASLVPCYHHGYVLACALGGIGAMRGTGEGMDLPRKATTRTTSAGGRVGIEVPLSGWLGFSAYGELRAALTRTTLQVDGRDAWSSPLVSGAVGGMLLGQVP